MGLRSLEDGYTPEILDVSQLDRKLLVSNADAVRGLRALLDQEGLWAGVSAGAVLDGRPARRREAGPRPERRHAARRRRLEVRLGRPLGPRRGRARRGDGVDGSGGSRRAAAAAARDGGRDRGARAGGAARRGVRHPLRRARRRAHARSIRPSTATRARTATRSTSQDLLRIVTDIEDAERGPLAIYHSHTRSPAFPSRTDVELAFWPDAAYLIVSLATRSARPARLPPGGTRGGRGRSRNRLRRGIASRAMPFEELKSPAAGDVGRGALRRDRRGDRRDPRHARRAHGAAARRAVARRRDRDRRDRAAARGARTRT